MKANGTTFTAATGCSTLDLAYAINVHIAQGMTADNGIILMSEKEKMLNSTQSFLVAVTRIADSATLVVETTSRRSSATLPGTPAARPRPSRRPIASRSSNSRRAAKGPRSRFRALSPCSHPHMFTRSHVNMTQ